MLPSDFHDVQNLEALCGNAHKMEVLRIKDKAMWTCLLTLLQFSLLFLNFIFWLHRFTDSWGKTPFPHNHNAELHCKRYAILCKQTGLFPNTSYSLMAGLPKKILKYCVFVNVE
jgi:hypothetical protein